MAAYMIRRLDFTRGHGKDCIAPPPTRVRVFYVLSGEVVLNLAVDTGTTYSPYFGEEIVSTDDYPIAIHCNKDVKWSVYFKLIDGGLFVTKGCGMEELDMSVAVSLKKKKIG